jgi:cytochrome c oxidase cbb3-type subunit 4
MDQMLYGWVAGISTLISMVAFIGVVAWSWSRRRKSEFDSLARLPLEEDAAAAQGGRS